MNTAVSDEQLAEKREWVICWQDLETGMIQMAEYKFTKAEAEKHCQTLNKAFPGLAHWAERVKS